MHRIIFLPSVDLCGGLQGPARCDRVRQGDIGAAGAGHHVSQVLRGDHPPAAQVMAAPASVQARKNRWGHGGEMVNCGPLRGLRKIVFD